MTQLCLIVTATSHCQLANAIYTTCNEAGGTFPSAVHTDKELGKACVDEWPGLYAV